MKPTKEQVLAEPAGRQMDAWVSVHVFGQECFQSKSVFGTDDFYIFNADASRVVPYYSTDIAAAWQVVEHMGAQSLPSLMQFPEVTPKWRCGFWNNSELGVHYTYGETAPLAICRAALLAVLNSEAQA